MIQIPLFPHSLMSKIFPTSHDVNKMSTNAKGSTAVLYEYLY